MHKFNLETILHKIPTARIGVIGDFCLDAYWDIDRSRSEISVETRLPTRPVRTQRYSLGGAGNVVHNLQSLGVTAVSVYGVTGRDPFGYHMRELFQALGSGTAGLLEQSENWITHTYIKPMEEGTESNRIDFGNFNRLDSSIARSLTQALEADLPQLDLVIINQQVTDGIHQSREFQALLQELVHAHPDKLFLVDGRTVSHRYAGTLRKINACEATLLAGGQCEPQDVIGLEDSRKAGLALAAEWQKPLFITRGERGCLVVDGDQTAIVPGLLIIEKTDPVGAGDSMLAGIAATMAIGLSPVAAATFGNFVAGVTVQKLYQTGTATPDEVRRIGKDADYIFLPEKADDPRSAIYWHGTEIELVSGMPPLEHAIAHAIFDHDGTISVLREGWEKIMEPMMIQAILGPIYKTADETTYHKVLHRIRAFIDSTTGVQTLVQMQGLAKLVAEFGFVSATDRLDEFGYKAIYNEALLNLVKGRLAKLERGELAVEDFVIKGIVPFMTRLHQAGVTLYLASGSDEGDVIAEAKALGYAHLFEGRIYGAVGDATKEAKKMVMDRILKDVGTTHVKRIAAFGDGPVEIREMKKRGGLAIGIASDEVRRFDLNQAKRRRLIRAGADFIIPDFSQGQPLLELMGLHSIQRGLSEPVHTA